LVLFKTKFDTSLLNVVCFVYAKNRSQVNLHTIGESMKKAEILDKIAGLLIYSTGEHNDDPIQMRINLRHLDSGIDDILDKSGYYKKNMRSKND
tara:strand:- start:90 stop:371 length:282 start_codon:yes stop_codon:yes gene_type:complete